MKVTLSEIEAAKQRIGRHVLETPIEYSSTFSNLAKCDFFLKLENHQKTGSFKIRGAANKILTLTDEEKKGGVIAASAGNHAQGVAYTANLLGIKSTIVMPAASPLIKVAATKGYGAEVILYGNNYDEAYSHSLELQKKFGLTFIHPYEDERVIAGQGTIGLEIFKQNPKVEIAIVPIGGGGLCAGIATALKALNPKIRIIGVQAKGANSMAESFRKGKLSSEPKPVSTICDGIAVKKPSPKMFEQFISKLCDDVVDVDDDKVAEAIVLLMERAKTVVEGAGAVSLAAFLNLKDKMAGKNVTCVLSGGNIDLNMVERIIDRGLKVSGRLVRMHVLAPDVPGTLNKITSLIAAQKANVLDVNHNRIGDQVHLRETIIEFTLETTGVEQIAKIKAEIENLGFKIII